MISYQNYAFRVIALVLFLSGNAKVCAMQPITVINEEGILNMLRAELNFSWSIGGMGKPRSAEDIKALAQLGVGGLVSLTQSPLPEEFFAGSSIRRLHIPLGADEAPTGSQALGFVRFILQVQYEKKEVVIHCDRGNARVSTFLAFYLLTASGSTETMLSVEKAIEIVKKGRSQAGMPGATQIAFLEACFK